MYAAPHGITTLYLYITLLLNIALGTVYPSLYGAQLNSVHILR